MWRIHHTKQCFQTKQFQGLVEGNYRLGNSPKNYTLYFLFFFLFTLRATVDTANILHC